MFYINERKVLVYREKSKICREPKNNQLQKISVFFVCLYVEISGRVEYRYL